jgi:cell division protein FtsB
MTTLPTAEEIADIVAVVEGARATSARVDAVYERMLKTLIHEGIVAREAIAQLEVENDSLREQIKQLRDGD